MKAFDNGNSFGLLYVYVFMDFSRGQPLKCVTWRRTIDLEAFKWPTAGAGAIATMYMVGRTIMRVFSRDKLEIVRDRTETNIVVGQFERIRELETANKDLTALYVAKVAELGEVKGEVKALSMQCFSQAGQIKGLEATIAAMQGQINELMMRAR